MQLMLAGRAESKPPVAHPLFTDLWVRPAAALLRRTVLETMRTLFVWLVDLVRPWRAAAWNASLAPARSSTNCSQPAAAAEQPPGWLIADRQFAPFVQLACACVVAWLLFRTAPAAT